MDLQVIVWFFHCCLLPAALLTGCLFRYSLFSLVYFLFLLLLPWFLCPNKHTIKGHTGRFIRAVFCSSLVFVLGHVCFQMVLYTYPPLDEALGDNCSQWDTISRHIGLSRLPLDDPWSVIRLLCPDLAVCAVALVTVILCCRLVRNREMVAAANITSLDDYQTDRNVADGDGEDEEVSGDEDEDERSSCGELEEEEEEVSTATRAKQLAEHLKRTAWKVLRDLGRILAVSLLALAGIAMPSAFSAVYFLLFIGVCTWWACHLPISHLGFNALCVMVGFFTAGHLVCLYLYQSLLVQALFPPHSLWARLFGLKDIIIPGNCSSPYELNLNSSHIWPVYVNPGIMLLLYFTIVIILKTGYHRTQEKQEDRDGPQKEMFELRSWSPRKDTCDDDTQVTLLSVGTESSQAAAGESPPGPPDPPDLGLSGAPSGQQSESPLSMLGRVVMQQSYICALIAMMVWSITYHSWLTFVLLLWACLIWILRASLANHLTKTRGKLKYVLKIFSGQTLIWFTSSCRCRYPSIPLKERVKIAQNWYDGVCKRHIPLKWKMKLLPWLQLDGDMLFLSQAADIRVYQVRRDRDRLHPKPSAVYSGHKGDVCRFSLTDSHLVSGGSDGKIRIHSRRSNTSVELSGHNQEVNCLDLRSGLIVTGSRDRTARVWTLTSVFPRSTVSMQDRVWSVALSPTLSSFGTGSACCENFSPLRIWDIERLECVCCLGSEFRRGAGILDMVFESPFHLCSCGYDTFIRLWDLRLSPRKCVLEWEEPHDSALYCIQTDGNHMIASGSAHYGVVRLWDKRQTRCLQFFQLSVDRESSPVYCLRFTSSHLYAALSTALHSLDFRHSARAHTRVSLV
ncbi:F-box/WD repeat-containing protein 4 [Thalassophryne amazonica]|uniref:F-box/WD repeat-containing protein 4 n=1 Tax=Thalassophryne amazonica TaxID=390379 RepID=UPI0014724D78|nr:F-box/WD repeat-containing protein 4 [Thalassophryne amazonica]